MNTAHSENSNSLETLNAIQRMKLEEAAQAPKSTKLWAGFYSLLAFSFGCCLAGISFNQTNLIVIGTCFTILALTQLIKRLNDNTHKRIDAISEFQKLPKPPTPKQ